MKCGIEVAWALGGLGLGSGKPPTERRLSVGGDAGDKLGGSYRQTGGRAMSLGFTQGKRRAAYGGSSRGSSVVGGE
jgi:alpha-1,3-glucosyltransferase